RVRAQRPAPGGDEPPRPDRQAPLLRPLLAGDAARAARARAAGSRLGHDPHAPLRHLRQRLQADVPERQHGQPDDGGDLVPAGAGARGGGPHRARRARGAGAHGRRTGRAEPLARLRPALHPATRVLAVARFAHQRALAERFGAAVLPHEPARSIVERVADETGAQIMTPWYGLPWLHGGGVDVVYDTVGLPETVEVGLRVAAPRGAIVVTGVEV